MTYQRLIDSMAAYGSTEEDICNLFIGVNNTDIQEKVIIAPWWEPELFNFGVSVEFFSDSESSAIKVWNVNTSQGSFTYIKTGIGAPVLTDIVLALGVTKCQELLFIGSVGSLDPDIHIGDIVIPEYSICGDGTSRYLNGGTLAENDPFGERSYPDAYYTQKLFQISKAICSQNDVRLHKGRNFSVDTIFAQFAYIDEIMELGCNVIEMETASAFKAAGISNIAITALFSVSDNTIQKKSLVSGRTEADMNYRREVRKNIFPLIFNKLFFDVSDDQ